MIDRPTVPVTGCTCPRGVHYHGTAAAYNSHDCRCEECRSARTRYDWNRKGVLEDRLAAMPPPVPDDPPFKSQAWMVMMRQGLLDALGRTL